MLLRNFGLGIIIAVLAMVGYCSGQENDVIEVIFIDGPGGYLPDVEVGANGNGADFEQSPLIVEEIPMNQLFEQSRIFSILEYWENYFRILFVF